MEFQEKPGNCGKILELKSTVTEGFHSRLTAAEKSICDLEDGLEENIHAKARTQKDKKRKRKIT